MRVVCAAPRRACDNGVNYAVLGRGDGELRILGEVCTAEKNCGRANMVDWCLWSVLSWWFDGLVILGEVSEAKKMGQSEDG